MGLGGRGLLGSDFLLSDLAKSVIPSAPLILHLQKKTADTPLPATEGWLVWAQNEVTAVRVLCELHQDPSEKSSPLSGQRVFANSLARSRAVSCFGAVPCFEVHLSHIPPAV